MRILLAEDERAMAEPIVAFLQYHKYTVDWVDNGADTYSQASAQAYDGLILARLDEKQWAGKTANIDFSQELNNEISIYDETVLQKELTLKTDVAPGLRIRAEEESVRQLLHVLLDNAMLYTPPGGSVWVSAAKEKKTLRLEITNTVDALPKIAPERLLDRFTRGDTARSRKNGGTGIGLSTAKSVADLYHGDITVAYQGDSLFQVTVRLPLSMN